MLIHKLLSLLAPFLFLFSSLPVHAEESSFFSGREGNRYVSTEIIFDLDSYNPEYDELPRAGILFSIKPDWHIYWKFPGESGKPTTVSWNLPDGWKTEDLKFPIPKRTLEQGDIQTFGYSEQVLIYTTLIPPSDIDLKNISSINVSAEVSWLVCFDRCIPGKSSITKNLPISSQKPEYSESNFYFEKTKRSVPLKISSQDKLRDKGITMYLQEGFKGSSLRSALYFELLHEISPKDHPSGAHPSRGQFFETSGYPIVGAPLISHQEKDRTILLLPLTETESGNTPSGVIAFEVEDTKRYLFEIPSFPFSELRPVPEEILSRASSFSESKFMTYSYKDNESAPQNSTTSLLLALISAFIGGIILNFMPCVLPILSIKLMGIVSAKEKSTSGNIRDAICFSTGILASFLLLAGVAVSLKTTGNALGWGFQFQYPEFVFALVIILFILSLGFFDLYIAEIPFINTLTKISSRGTSENSYSKHFFDGILISALSTPCTAPFLGTALVFAFSQSTLSLFLVFIAIGVGLAAPYFLVVSQPRLLKLFPKPGAWMNRIKQLMGFSLLATIIWLLKVLEKSVPGSAFRGTGILLALYVFFWFWSWAKEQKTAFAKSVLFLTGIAVPVISWIYLNPLSKHETVSGAIQWQEYDEAYFEYDSPIFIDFTAEWCITCKYNENFILTKPAIRKRFQELGIIALKADWTTGSDKITAALEKFGGTGVPHYVFIPKKNEPYVTLPTILTEESVIKELSINP